MKLSIKKLQVKKDHRGWLAEIIDTKDVDGKQFGLALLTTALPGKTKGNHYHLRKREWYCVIKGKGKLIIRNPKTGKVEVQKIMNAKRLELVEVPIGYFHAIKNVSDEEMYLLAYVSEAFNPKDPDTYYE